jgi:hypothetical protein
VVSLYRISGKQVCQRAHHVSTPRQASWSENKTSESGVLAEVPKRLTSLSHRTAGGWLEVGSWALAHLDIECASCVGQGFHPENRTGLRGARLRILFTR